MSDLKRSKILDKRLMKHRQKLTHKLEKVKRNKMVKVNEQQQDQNFKLSNLKLLTATNAIKFSGNPLYYHSFISGYNSAVEGIKDDHMKLKALFALCEGEALDSVQFSLLRAPTEGHHHSNTSGVL